MSESGTFDPTPMAQRILDLERHIKTQNMIEREERRILQRWKEYAFLMQEQRDQAMKLAETLSRGTGACRDVHHCKKDQHGPSDPCPPEDRWNQAKEDLQALRSEIKMVGKSSTDENANFQPSKP